MKLIYKEKIERVAGVCSFILQPTEEVNWSPGQFMFYTLPHENMDNKGDTRYFTISSAPFEKNIAITTRLTGSSFKNKLNSMKVGDTIEADGPEGEFIVPIDRDNLVFIAGGIGITPFRSILAQMYNDKVTKNIELIYANRDNNIIFKSEIDKIASRFPSLKVKYLIDPERVDEQLLLNYIAPEKYFYVSGPKPMAEGISKMLANMRVDKTKIIEDFFPGYKEY